MIASTETLSAMTDIQLATHWCSLLVERDHGAWNPITKAELELTEAEVKARVG